MSDAELCVDTLTPSGVVMIYVCGRGNVHATGWWGLHAFPCHCSRFDLALFLWQNDLNGATSEPWRFRLNTASNGLQET